VRRPERRAACPAICTTVHDVSARARATPGRGGATPSPRHGRRGAPKLYCTDEDGDGDWNGAIADPAVVEDAWRRWRAEVELTDQFVAGVADLGTRNVGVSDLGPDGADLQLRDILVAQIAEYARQCGHADLLRERIDGRVGQ